MRKLITAMVIGLVLASSALALVGTASAKNTAPHARNAHAVHVNAAHNGSTHTAPSSSGTEDPSSESDSSDSSDSSSESSTDGSSSTETDTHQDPGGQDANHECPPNCDTTSGEQL